MGATAFLRQILATDTLLARLARARPHSRAVNVLIGVAYAVGFLALRWAASAFYKDITGFMILLPAVVLAGLAAGRIAGVTAVFASLIGGWLLVGTDGPGGLSTPLGQIATVNFLIVGLFVALIAASLRKTVNSLDETVAALKVSNVRVGQTELELGAIIEQASAGIARVGLDGIIQTANSRFAEILGMTEAKLVGSATVDITWPDDVAPTKALLASALVGGAGQIEKRYYRGDGSVVWALTSLQRLLGPDGKPKGFIAVIVDISEAKQTEAALRESEERFRLMADTAPSPVWLTNAGGEVEFVNEALAAFYGGPAREVLGHVWRQSMHPDDVAAVNAAQAEARPAQKPYGFECRFRRHDGVWRWMRVSVNPRFDGQGRFQGYVGMSFDVTETREAIEALARQAQRQRFLLSLSDTLRELTDTDAVMAEANRALGERLGVNRVGFGEIDNEAGVWRLARDWTSGVASNEGELPVGDFTDPVRSELSEGRLVAIDDAALDPRTAPDIKAHIELEALAFAAIPLMRGGRLRAFFNVASAGPRVWTADELGLIDEVAERAWVEVERTRAQAEVAESEARFRAIADTAPVLIWVTQQDRQRAFVNQAYVAFMGGDYESVRTADWRTYIHPDDQERLVRESFAGEATHEPFSLEARYKNHNGEYRWLKSFSRPRLGAGGQVLGFVGVAFDVTDAREAQALLAESEARFRTVADSAPALIWMTDERPGIVFTNKRYKTFFNVDAEDIRDDRWMGFIHPDDVKVFSLTFLRAFKARDRFEAVMRVQHPTFGQRWLRSEGVPRFDATGVFQGYVGASLDITDAKRAEDDLKRINELLEERVGEALAEKAKAEADLMHAQRMEAVGRLTGGVAHDFNNLLTVVIGALDMILKSPDNAARRKKLGEAALAAARRGEGLTHQLLAFSRRQALRPEPVDLNALILESEPLLRRAVGEAVEYRMKLRRGGARVSVDPAQFEAALLNLMVNARDAVGARSKGRITVQTMSCSVEAGEVSELTPGQYVCVTVSDNGAGMDAATMTRVFEPFFTTKAVGKGTGLGLSQVYGFARQSGGGVHIASTVGRGTEIKLYLPPLDTAEVVASAEDRMEIDAIPSGRRLLLVEDDVGVAAIAMELLTGLGLDVEAAETGPEALERLAARSFDVMLTDVVMPGGMTGIELARICAERHPEMRILLTSGYAGDDVDEALSDAPWPFLRKPYSGDQLRQALGELLPLN
jgi:PAS domain S-box-containing protein